MAKGGVFPGALPVGQYLSFLVTSQAGRQWELEISGRTILGWLVSWLID